MAGLADQRRMGAQQCEIRIRGMIEIGHLPRLGSMAGGAFGPEGSFMGVFFEMT